MTDISITPPTADELRAAYRDGDCAAPATAPLLRERRMAWQVAEAFGFALSRRGGALRDRVRAERDYLDKFLRERRKEMPARVVADFTEALGALSAAVAELDGAAARDDDAQAIRTGAAAQRERMATGSRLRSRAL